jgi:hypothetical protein
VSALDLARLRALAAAPIVTAAALDAPAARIGRITRRAGSVVVLARHPEAPTAADVGALTSRLADTALVALGLCVGLAWDDRNAHPFPGRPFTLDELLAAATTLGVTVAGSRHLVGAVRHVLTQAKLLTIDEHDVLRLGPVLAGWSDGDLEVLRRNLDVLPEPGGSTP